MDAVEFLNQPIKVIAPGGYQACLDCAKYFHHPIIYCPTCGQLINRWTEISIIDFFQKTAKSGDGPLNTLWGYLRRLERLEGGGYSLCRLDNPEYRAIYALAEKAYEEFGGPISGTFHPDGVFTPLSD